MRTRTESAPRPARAAERSTILIRAAAFLAAVVFVVGPAPAAARAMAPEDAASIIECTLERYRSAESHRIEFLQESYWALADTTYVTSGVLFLERPSSVAVRYADGGGVVSNGETLRVYVAATNQFFVAAVDSSDLLLDPVRLLEAYRPDPESPTPSPEDSAVTIAMARRRPGTEPARLEVTVDRVSCDLSEIVAIATSGDRTRYAIRKTSRNADLPSDAFRLPKPDGAETIRGFPQGE